MISQIVGIGLRGGFNELSSSNHLWQHHNKIGQDARRFGTSERVKSLFESDERESQDDLENHHDGQIKKESQAETDNEAVEQSQRKAVASDSPLVQHIIKQYRIRKQGEEEEEGAPKAP